MFVSQLWADQPRSAERIVSAPASKMFASILLLSIILTGLSCTNLWCGHSQEWNKSFSTVDLMSHNNPHQFSKNQITVLSLMATIVSTNRSVQSDQRGESPVQPHRWCWWDVASQAWRPSPDDQQGVRPALHQTQRPGGAWQLPPRQGGPRQSCGRTPRPLFWRCPGVVHRKVYYLYEINCIYMEMFRSCNFFKDQQRCLRETNQQNTRGLPGGHHSLSGETPASGTLVDQTYHV